MQGGRKWGIPGAIFLGLLLLYFPAFILGPAIGAIVYAIPVGENNQSTIARLAVELLTIGAVLLVIKLYGRTLTDIALQGWPKIRHALQALAGFGIYFFLSICILVLITIVFGLNLDEEQNLGYEQLRGIELIGAFIALVLLTPLAEEMVFRGFMFHGLRRRLPFWAAALIVSILFGIVHMQLNVGLDVFALSMVLCYLTEKSKSLWPAIMLHAIKNSVAFYMLYLYNG